MEQGVVCMLCMMRTGESCFEVKIEADGDSMLEYAHDDVQTMGMLLFIALSGSGDNIVFISGFSL